MAGGQTVLLSILADAKKHYEVEVLLFNRGPIEEKIKELGLKTHFIQAPAKVKFRYVFEMALFLKKTYEFLKQGGYGLIYSSGFFATKLIAFPAYFLKIPVIWHKHQIITKGYFSYNASHIRFFSHFVSKIICVSEASARSLEKAGVEKKKVTVIHNGMEIPAMNHTARSKAVRKKFSLTGAFVAGTIGYFRRNKGIDLLIRAAAIVKIKNEDIKFLLVGKAESADMNYEIELKNLVKKLGVEKNVIFAGFGKKFDFLPAFDIFVLPSDNEPFALSVLESLGAGVPVIAFDSGGTPEVVRDGYNGFIVPKMNDDALAQAILNVYDGRKRLKKMGKNAAMNIRKEFTMKKQMKEIRTIIKTFISR
jgi:glycosyltransferase involved in cell wall biosynthesis